VRRGLIDDRQIEDLPNCCNACEENISLIEEVQQNAPDLWPSAKQFKPPTPASVFMASLTKLLFASGYILAVVVSILYLINEYA